MPRKIDYLFQRRHSGNWQVKLQGTSGRVEKSLGTPDRRLAELRALPMIAEHKAALLAAQPRYESIPAYQYEPGREHVDDGGRRIIATEQELIFLDANGGITDRKPNGFSQYRLVGAKTGRSFVRALSEVPFPGHVDGRPFLTVGRKRPVVATKDGDDAILETYLKHANVTGYYEREARAAWALYKQLTHNKPLKDATREDGHTLATYFEDQGLRSATIAKKVGWLTAACNLAIKDNQLKFNPFSSIVPKRNDKQRRLPLDDADMKACRQNLGKLSAEDQLLFRFLASTGARLSEAFQFDGELTERGVRFVVLGTKTEQSLRRVPLPAAVLPHLPTAIRGKLFAGTPAAASKRLNRFLRGVGIADPRKVVHSLRHRAQDRLRAAGCPEDIRWALLGHEEKTVAAGYGEGFPVPLLKRWVDKIGF
jgi:integrase